MCYNKIMPRNVPYKRMDRVSDVIRRVVSETLIGKVHHLGLEEVTITGVDISPDIKHGKVYFRVLNEKKLGSIKESLEKIRPIVQRQMSKELQTRYIPVLNFVYDESFDRGEKIFKLLESVKNSSHS